MFPVRRPLSAEERATRDRQWLMSFFLEFDELSELASRLLRDPGCKPVPELTDLADRAHEFRDALLALQDKVVALETALSGGEPHAL